jgi:hypothetical protein
VTEREATALEFVAAPDVGARRLALADAVSAFWASRAIVWIAGLAALAIFGTTTGAEARLDPLYLTFSFNHFADLLAAPAARFDSVWFLAISQHGYEVNGRPAFFPLLPMLISAGGSLTGSALFAGILISSALGLVALYLLHRLVMLDFDAIDARNAVRITAFLPSAFVLSAVYSESLFLVVSVGAIYSARLGRWALAGILGALAAATRSTGLLLVLPLLFIYLYGPRADRPPRGFGADLRPRHRLAPDIAWLALVPLGLVAYLVFLGLTTGDPLSAFSAQSQWDRAFAPLAAVPLGAWAAIRGVFELVPGDALPGVAGAPTGLLATGMAVRDIVEFGFLCLAGWLVFEGRRRLPPAYTVWTVTALALPLSVPATDEPLMSLPRFMLVLFPLWITLALWARERNRVGRVIAAMLPLLVIYTGLFTTWSMSP